MFQNPCQRQEPIHPHRALQGDVFPTSQGDQDSQIKYVKRPGEDLCQINREPKLRRNTEQEVINQMRHSKKCQHQVKKELTLNVVLCPFTIP